MSLQHRLGASRLENACGLQGKTAVVVGRSNIVGLPAALLLMKRDATVTMVHSCTPNSKEVVQRADIVIAACGQAEMIKGDWIKPGAAVIDVGTNAIPVRCLPAYDGSFTDFH